MVAVAQGHSFAMLHLSNHAHVNASKSVGIGCRQKQIAVQPVHAASTAVYHTVPTSHIYSSRSVSGNL